MDAVSISLLSLLAGMGVVLFVLECARGFVAKAGVILGALAAALAAVSCTQLDTPADFEPAALWVLFAAYFFWSTVLAVWSVLQEGAPPLA